MHNASGVGERYHTPLRRVYSSGIKSYPKLGEKSVLRLLIKAMNDTMGPEGLVPLQLIFGVIPSLPVINKLPSVHRDQMAALSIACVEMSTVSTELKIAQAFRSKLPLLPILSSSQATWCEYTKSRNADGAGPPQFYGQLVRK